MSILSTYAHFPDNAITALTSGALLEAKDYITADAGTVHDLIELAGKGTLGSFDLAACLDIFAYEGFDVMVVYRHLAAIKTRAAIGDDAFTEDIKTLLVLQHLKGNISTANIKGIKGRAQQVIAALLSKYQIQLKIGNSKKDAVTLPRLATAFPVLTVDIASQVPHSYGGPFESKKLPGCMMTSVFASVVPASEKVTSTLLYASVCYTTDQMFALQKLGYSTMKKEELLEKFEDQKKYADIAFSSSVVDQADRHNCVRSLNLADKFAVCYERAKFAGMKDSDACTQAEWDAYFAVAPSAAASGKKAIGPPPPASGPAAPGPSARSSSPVLP